MQKIKVKIVKKEIKIVSRKKAESDKYIYLWTKSCIWNNDSNLDMLYDDNNNVISKY